MQIKNKIIFLFIVCVLNLSFLTDSNLWAEEFDIEDDKPQKGNMITENKIEDLPDDSKFNTEKHHKRQHKF